jgi:hypothetical protein
MMLADTYAVSCIGLIPAVPHWKDLTALGGMGGRTSGCRCNAPVRSITAQRSRQTQTSVGGIIVSPIDR